MKDDTAMSSANDLEGRMLLKNNSNGDEYEYEYDDQHHHLTIPLVSDHHHHYEDDNDEWMHALGSFFVMITPVTLTMLLSSWVVLHIQSPESLQQPIDEYLIYKPHTSDNNSTKFEHAFINALAIIGAILVSTFVIVFCYKMDCVKPLVLYMMFSSFMLLGLLGGYVSALGLATYHIEIDVITFACVIYNFSTVGVLSIFYQKGISSTLTQSYLVLTSVIFAWQLGNFPEWTTWTLLVLLGLYDLCAVLTPCGPLKLLVNLVEKKGTPLPGLLYEADVPSFKSAEELKYGTNAGDETNKSMNNNIIEELHHSTTDEMRYSATTTTAIHHHHQQYDRTIKLGLGDFIFYSALVSRAAMFDITCMVSTLLTVLTGLGTTLLLLAIYKQALPALPISIFMATIVYFLNRMFLHHMLVQLVQNLAII